MKPVVEMGKIDIQNPHQEHQQDGARGGTGGKETVIAALDRRQVVENADQEIDRGENQDPFQKVYKECIEIGVVDEVGFDVINRQGCQNEKAGHKDDDDEDQNHQHGT